MSDKALEALRLYDVWESIPTDRGGKDGPKGRAFEAFLKAKEEAQSVDPTPFPISDDWIFNAVYEYVGEQIGHHTVIFRASDFIDDLGCDELDMIEILMWAEDRFVIVIDDDTADALNTVHDLCEAIRSRVDRTFK